MAKQYGLIIPDTKKSSNSKPALPRTSVFGDDSDSDETAAPVFKPSLTGVQKNLAKKIQQQALKEDATIFQYDELYDDMVSKKEEEKKQAATVDAKKPKYIAKLIETAEKRKKEYERRIERQVQKERELEGDMYKDKESFVTASYRQKLEEMKKAEEEEKRNDYLEAIGEVTKQNDLSGFYRHLYEQKLGPKEPKPSNEEPKSNSSDDSKPEISDKITKPKTNPKVRSYRKRTNSNNPDGQSKNDVTANSDNEEADEVANPSKRIHLQSNLDADSDFSIDSSSESDTNEDDKPKDNLDPKSNKTDSAEQNDSLIKEKDNACFKLPTPVTVKEEVSNNDNEKSSVESESETPVPEPVKIKIDIWLKRTVGQAFDDAVQRYYERKANRSSN